MSHTVRDSSIWYDSDTLDMIEGQDYKLCFGVVLEAINNKDNNELRYLVEVYYKTDKTIVECRMLRQYGGVYNYEDFVMRGYQFDTPNGSRDGILTIPGDVVLVGKIGGSAMEGVILGSMTHPARKSFLDSTKGPQYRSEFNGIETFINDKGEWTLTFKGQPTNLSKLNDAPNGVVAEPKYDKDVGTSFMKWDKTGSFTLSDEATDGDKVQKLFVDKKNGTIDIFSGKINLKFKKDGQKVSLTNKDTLITSEDKIVYKTKKFNGEATTEIRVKTPLYVVESDKVRLGAEDAKEWLIIGTTFRREQKTMNDIVADKLAEAFAALDTAKTQISTAASSLTTQGGIPAVSGVPPVNLVSAGTALSQASTAIGDAATALGEAGDAIATFENNSSAHDYQSKISKTK